MTQRWTRTVKNQASGPALDAKLAQEEDIGSSDESVSSQKRDETQTEEQQPLLLNVSAEVAQDRKTAQLHEKIFRAKNMINHGFYMRHNISCKEPHKQEYMDLFLAITKDKVTNNYQLELFNYLVHSADHVDSLDATHLMQSDKEVQFVVSVDKNREIAAVIALEKTKGEALPEK